MNSETRLLRAVLGRMLLAGVFAVAAGTAATAPTTTSTSHNSCRRTVPPSHRRTRCHRRIHVRGAASSRGVGQRHRIGIEEREL
jgi:hypothetical protein